MEFNTKDFEKITNRTRRLFAKYTQEYNLTPGQSTGKVLYELENTFEASPIFELYAYVELFQINAGEPKVLEYIKGLILDWIRTTPFEDQDEINDLQKKLENLHQDLNLVFR